MASKQLSIQLSSAQLYWLYLFLFVGDVAFAFVVKIVPATWGVAGLSVLAIGFLGTLADEYTVQKTPNGLPSWVTYLVMTAVMAVAATIGSFTSDTFLTVASVTAWLILVLGYIGQDLAQDAGASAPAYIETYIQTFVGAAIAFLTWYGNNPSATTGAIIATIVGILVSVFDTTGGLAPGPAPAPSSATAAVHP